MSKKNNIFAWNDAIAAGMQLTASQSELIKALGGIPTHMLIDELQKRIANMPDHSRMQVWSELQTGYCIECGTANPQCQCWNDE